MGYYLKQMPSPNGENPIIIKLDKQETLIGRKTPGLNGYSALSKYHALVYKSDDGSMYVKDMNSTNGVFINCEKIGPQPKRLVVGDTIGFGVPSIFYTRNQKVMGYVCEVLSEDIDPDIIVERVKIKKHVNVILKNKKALKPQAVLNNSSQEIESIESIQEFVFQESSDKHPASIANEVSTETHKNNDDNEKRIKSDGRRHEAVKSNNSHKDKSSDVDDNSEEERIIFPTVRHDKISSATYKNTGRVLLTDPKPMPVTEKTSRGRPRKENQVENKVTDKPSDAPKYISSATYQDTGRVLLTDPKPMPASEKKKQGRPRKEIRVEDKVIDKPSDAPKYISSTTYQDTGKVLLTDPKPMPAKEKGKLGRSRKEIQVEDKVIDRSSDLPKYISSATYQDTGRVLLTDPKPMPAKEKGKRGRPRKETQVEDRVIYRPSDAPKYISSATYQDTGRVLLIDAKPMPAKEKGKRGRPRKETQVEDKVIHKPSDAPKTISAVKRNASIRVQASETQKSSASLKPLCTDDVPKKRKAPVKVRPESFGSRGNFLTTETQIKPLKRTQSTSESAPLRIRIRKDNSTYKVVSYTSSTDKETIPVTIENEGQDRLVQNKTISNATSEKIPSPSTLGSCSFDSIPERSSLTAKTIHRERLKALIPTVSLTRCDKKK